MRVAVVGAGAMGSIFGAHLAEAGQEVALVDVARPVVEAIEADGLRIDDKAGGSRTVRLRATTDPATVGPVDLAVVFVKCYHTEAAVRMAAPLIGPGTAVLSLQRSASHVQRAKPARPPSETRPSVDGRTAVPSTSSAATTTSETRAPQAHAVGK